MSFTTDTTATKTATSPQATAASPDYAAIKLRQQAAWSSGDFAVIGVTIQAVGESLVEAVNLQAGERVLDVAAGNGNATLAAARHFADVTSTDYVPALLDKGRARAQAEGLSVQFQVADVEALPFDDRSFDVVLSTYGVMFAPNHQQSSREMLRVTRSGGRIGMANWTPEGFIGRLFKIIGAHVPPPAGVKSPALWGTEPYMVELFGTQASNIQCERRTFNFRYTSAAHWLQIFRDFYGPMNKAFASLQGAAHQALERDIIKLLQEMNTAGTKSLVVPGEYLEVVVTKR
jgi:ubiquinone/menaquinone biosynthesis C-methylase UbiE